MDASISLALVSLGLIIFLSHLFASIFSKKMIPDVLFLMLIGLILGPLAGMLLPSHFGRVGPIFTTITLVVILFEGGTSLSLKVLKSVWKSTMTLTLSCFVAMVVLIGLISYFWLDFSILEAVTLGATLGGTSSAVVIPIVHKLEMGEETRTILVLESVLTDVLCVIVALASIQAYKVGHINIGATLGSVIASFILATAIGMVGAMLWSKTLNKIRLIQNSIFTTPAFVFIIYGISDLLSFNGAIAALAFGVTIANLDEFKGSYFRRFMGRDPHKLNEIEMVFLNEITFLLKTFFFVYIGISIVFDNVQTLLVGAVLTLAIYLARMVIAKFCSPKSASTKDKSVIAIMAPKGLAAAVLATIPELVGMPEGTRIKNYTYAVVLFSIILTSILIILDDKMPFLQRVYRFFFSPHKKSKKKESDITDVTKG